METRDQSGAVLMAQVTDGDSLVAGEMGEEVRVWTNLEGRARFAEGWDVDVGRGQGEAEA